MRARKQFQQAAASLRTRLLDISSSFVAGRVIGRNQISVEVGGLNSLTLVGDRLTVIRNGGTPNISEVVSCRANAAQAINLRHQNGPGIGQFGVLAEAKVVAALQVDEGWLGRVLDPLAHPLDGKGPLPRSEIARPLYANPLDAGQRAGLGTRLDLGVTAINIFATCRLGQRLGVFSGSGVGKSTLLSMFVRRARCDVTVIALIGERSREVREFVDEAIETQSLTHSSVVVATSDAPAPLQYRAAYTAMTIAEHFRDRGQSVLLIIDSLTRFCHALREMRILAGEPPVMRGYPPSVFAEMAALLERAGPGGLRSGGGYITALVSILVEGDDFNEPIADAVRGVIDGHIILDRRIGEAGRYPAVDILRSLSRVASNANSEAQNHLILRARKILATAASVTDSIRLGAYKSGVDSTIDSALLIASRIEDLLRQEKDYYCDLESCFLRLESALVDKV